jgi:hypothetical protein
MTPIEIPFATPPVRWFMGFACLFFAGVIFGWLGPKFLLYLRRLQTLKSSVALVGGVFYGLMFAFALIPTMILIELVQNPKTVISDGGIAEDATVLHGSKRIQWSKIQRVSCLISRSGRVTGLTVRAIDGTKITLGNSGTNMLGPAYALLHSRLGDGVVQRCWVPFEQ